MNKTVALALLLALSACGDSEQKASQQIDVAARPTEALVRRWNEGVSLFDHYEFERAAEQFEGIAKEHPSFAAAWTNAGIGRMNQATPESMELAKAHYSKALAQAPKLLTALHCKGVLHSYLGEFEAAEASFRALLNEDPKDATASYYLASVLISTGRAKEAEPLLRQAIETEPHQASAIKNLASLLRRRGEEELAAEWLAIFQAFREAETGNLAGIVYSEMGRYGEAIRSPWTSQDADARPELALSFRSSEADQQLLAALSNDQPRLKTPLSALQDLNREARIALAAQFGPGLALADLDGDGDLDAWLGVAGPAEAESGPSDAGTLWRNDRGQFVQVEQSLMPKTPGDPAMSGLFGDFDNDGQPELFLACVGKNRYWSFKDGVFVDQSRESGLAEDEAFTSGATAADFDADGDLDLAVANLSPERGLANEVKKSQLFTNLRTGAFKDLSPKVAELAKGFSAVSVFAADFDRDDDADLWFGGATGSQLLLRNDRIERYATWKEPFAPQLDFTVGGLLAADFDRDGQDEYLALPLKFGRAPVLFANVRGAFSAHPMGADLPKGHSAAVADFDGDGWLDLIIAGDAEATLLKNERGRFTRIPGLPEALSNKALRSLIAADLNGDGIVDLIASYAGLARPIVFAGALDPKQQKSGAAQWLGIDLLGRREAGKMRANTGGIGARVTVVSGTTAQSRSLLATGGVLGGLPARLEFGLSAAAEADYVSVRWPDALLQGEAKVSAGRVHRIAQTYRKSSSCPLLFVERNGRMEFVTDFLGTGGLGFFLSPGVYATPDPTERVLLPQWPKAERQLKISIHEPMEEICYLDQARMLVVDHSAAVEVHPDERLATGAPVPEDRLFVTRKDARLYPIALKTKEGAADVTAITRADRLYAKGVHPDPRFLGYAAPQRLEFQFDRALTPLEDLILFLEGWVEYPYSHVNFAAFQAGLREQTLSLWVERESGWTMLLREFGYPAGMPRVMTVPLPPLPADWTGRLALETNLELYIDALWLAQDLGESAVRRTSLAPARADLKQSGYPREYSPDGQLPLLYDYALMDPAIDFKTMSGAYTRFGDVLPLLEFADDRYVIFGRAEEILLTYELPEAPAAGMTRTLILDSVGYCKDMDHYTAFPTTVEPLPFRAMSSYPYPAEQSPLFVAEFLDYHRKWNTRILRGSR